MDNMNGRIYDPVIAQFVQPDNYIQAPEDYISYDRYTYVRGNPFRYTDPSGEWNQSKEKYDGTVVTREPVVIPLFQNETVETKNNY